MEDCKWNDIRHLTYKAIYFKACSYGTVCDLMLSVATAATGLSKDCACVYSDAVKFDKNIENWTSCLKKKQKCKQLYEIYENFTRYKYQILIFKTNVLNTRMCLQNT